MNIEKTLGKLRIQKGLKQGEAAKLIGISQTHLSQIESGKKDLSTKVLKKIAAAYKVPLSAMLLMALDSEDVEPDKREAFNQIKPSLEALLKSVYNV